jgi:glycosyltransferase involved in cell wall biosynthesis
MRILMLTASLPYPPHQGGALRSYGILHGLAAAGHDISLLSFHEPNGNIADTPLGQYCSRIETLPPPGRSKSSRLRDLALTGQPDIARRLYNRDFLDRLTQTVRETTYDLIQFEGIEIAPYLLPLRKMGTKAKLVYDAFNAEAALQYAIFQVDRGNPHRWPAAAYSFIQSRRIERFERALCTAADAVIAVSDEDARILCRFRSDGRVPVVNNGIFVSDYETPGAELDLGEHVLVFTGKMDYRPNVDAMDWFAENVLPDIQKAVPDTKLYIVGQKPHPRLERLRHQHHIEITGWVKDVQPFLHSADVYVAPLRMGSGTRLKILEAMAAGRAVVATTVAISGMHPAVHDATLVADKPERMSEAVVKLLGDPTRRAELGERARAYVRQYYDWSALIPKLLTAYKEIGLG